MLAGREFLDRFAALAVEGAAIMAWAFSFPKSQYPRQHVVMGFGTPSYKALVALTRLGYTPRFVTEEEIATGRAGDVAALVVIGQTFALPEKVNAGWPPSRSMAGASWWTARLPLRFQARKDSDDFPVHRAGQAAQLDCAQHGGQRERHNALRALPSRSGHSVLEALGDTGRAWLESGKGVDSRISLLQIDGGHDARYIVAVNDSRVATQADWHQVKETLVPLAGSGGELSQKGFLYDCTDEKAWVG